MNTQAHSALPWRADYVMDGHHKITGQPFVSGEVQTTHVQGIAFQIQHKADAAYIVRACNAHETLIAALRAAHEALLYVKGADEPGDMPDPLIEQIEGALRLAQGEQP